MTHKPTIRKNFLTKRNQLNNQSVQQLSDVICQQVLSRFNLMELNAVASYYSISNEVNLNTLLTSHQNIYLPVIKPNHSMQFGQFQSCKNLTKNKFGIPEPNETKTIPASEISICFVPLVAFNRQGARLGMGGGYYDRYFEHNKSNKNPTLLVGIAYDFQESDTIKAQKWDIPLDMIITNKEVITP